jgi:hypothetical protein
MLSFSLFKDGRGVSLRAGVSIFVQACTMLVLFGMLNAQPQSRGFAASSLYRHFHLYMLAPCLYLFPCRRCNPLKQKFTRLVCTGQKSFNLTQVSLDLQHVSIARASHTSVPVPSAFELSATALSFFECLSWDGCLPYFLSERHVCVKLPLAIVRIPWAV